MEQTPLFRTPDERSAREKNLIALLILIAGLFLGSVAIDIAQLFVGSGFSERAVRTHDLLVAGGKTWVAYTDPKVTLRVVTDTDCAECDPDEALVWLRRIVPTVEAVKIEDDTDEGKQLIQDYGLRTLPSFVFGPTVTATDFYREAEPLFLEKNDQYVFDMNRIGLPIGKYLVAPSVGESRIILGNREAGLTVTLFSDFQCQFCASFHTEFKKLVTEYGDRVRFVFKHLPLPNHLQAENAAQAAECAFEQGKFNEYSDWLFARQVEWGKIEGLQAFKNAAWRIAGMNGAEFSRCLESGRHTKTITRDLMDAQDFGLVSAPTTFIGTEVVTGAASFADLQPIMDQALGETGE